MPGTEQRPDGDEGEQEAVGADDVRVRAAARHSADHRCHAVGEPRGNSAGNAQKRNACQVELPAGGGKRGAHDVHCQRQHLQQAHSLAEQQHRCDGGEDGRGVQQHGAYRDAGIRDGHGVDNVVQAVGHGAQHCAGYQRFRVHLERAHAVLRYRDGGHDKKGEPHADEAGGCRSGAVQLHQLHQGANQPPEHAGNEYLQDGGGVVARFAHRRRSFPFFLLPWLLDSIPVRAALRRESPFCPTRACGTGRLLRLSWAYRKS